MEVTNDNHIGDDEEVYPLKKLAMNLLERNYGWVELQCLENKGGSSDVQDTEIGFDVPCSNQTVRYPTSTECSDTVQESTVTLMTARAFAKAGNSIRAWEAIESLLATAYDNGFLPMYRTINTTVKNDPYYGYISSLPLHASVVLEVYGWSNRTALDTQHLERSFQTIYRYHKYLFAQRQGFNVVHPMELLTDFHLDSYWNKALYKIHERIHNFTSSSSLSSDLWTRANQLLHSSTPQRRDRWIETLTYLRDCQVNNTSDDDDDDNVLKKKKKKKKKQKHHQGANTTRTVIEQCPFAIQDVAYSAVWANANGALQTIGQLLWDKRILSNRDLLEQLETWTQDSQTELESLWNPKERRFLSKTLFHPPGTDEWLTPADASTFVAVWQPALNQSWISDLVFGLLEHKQPYHFDCGDPLWSMGGCRPNSTISPFLNYLVSSGLIRNKAGGIGGYMTNSTLNMVCGNWDNNYACSSTLPFPLRYDARTLEPVMTQHPCGATSTLTAAVAYNMLIPDPPVFFSMVPPLRSSWVILLIVGELIVAFSIGVGCLVMSLKMSRILRRSINNENESLEEATQEYYAAYETLSDCGDGQDDEYEVLSDDITEPTSPSRRRRRQQ